MGRRQGGQLQIAQRRAGRRSAQEFRGDHGGDALNTLLAQRGGGQFRTALPQHLVAAPLGQRLHQGQRFAASQAEPLHPQGIEVVACRRRGLWAMGHQGLGRGGVPEASLRR